MWRFLCAFAFISISGINAAEDDVGVELPQYQFKPVRELCEFSSSLSAMEVKLILK